MGMFVLGAALVLAPFFLSLAWAAFKGLCRFFWWPFKRLWQVGVAWARGDFDRPQLPVDDEPWDCPECGTQVNWSYDYCPGCGLYLYEEDPEEAPMGSEVSYFPEENPGQDNGFRLNP